MTRAFITATFRKVLCVGAIAGGLTGGPALALTITFDYSYDAAGFFSGANTGRRGVLEQAAAAFSSRLTDSLTAITPAGGNTWTASFAHPSNPGTTVSLSNLSISADTIVVYIGATDLGAGALGQGAPGGVSASGNANWTSTVTTRGQPGAAGLNPTDFGPWGGAITFNSTAAWHFDSNPATLENFPGQFDFYSIALRELGHVLGFGTSGSWFSNMPGSTPSAAAFGGANAVAVYGGQVPLAAGNAHWLSGTTSTALGSGAPQDAVMGATLSAGTRTYLTALDAAALQDVGWTVVPEASSIVWSAVLGAAGVLGWLRRRKA
ncbi:MAG: hypothetical protein Q8N18_22120 [Opitutaceae bacterium]|nr:hypothetical protein [Opitutaceae bacterium]